MLGVSKKLIMPVMAILLCLSSISNAHAKSGNSTDGQWEYSLAPLFVWAQGIEGTSQIGPTEAPLDITFKDALDNLGGMFTVHYEMKRDALSLFAEYQYVNLDPEVEGPMNTELSIDFKDTLAELGVGYWAFGTDRTNWEVIAGARYNKQKLDLSFVNGPDLLLTSEDWWVAFFGGRFSANFSENWSFIGRVDYGLGAGKTNKIWNLNAMLSYRFKHWGSVFAGYKWMDYNYENSSAGANHYAYDATQQGPLLGLNIHW
jgi:hypothetical protein